MCLPCAAVMLWPLVSWRRCCGGVTGFEPGWRCAAGGLAIVTSALFVGMAALWYAFSNPYHVITITTGLSWIACFYVTVLLLVLVSPAGLIARAARARWLRELGRVSFCVYLIHLGVLYVAFGFVLRRIPQITDLRCIALAIVCAVATYLIARLSWVYIEDPLIRVGHRALYKSKGEFVRATEIPVGRT